MPADRLAELLRQRALLQDHAAWLDREIAAAKNQPAAGGSAVLPSRPDAMTSGVTRASSIAAPGLSAASEAAAKTIFSTTAPALSPAATAAVAPQEALVADAILDEYRVAPDALKTDVRQGCFLYLIAAFAALGLVVTVLYFTINRK